MKANRTILLVDDVEMNRHMLKNAFSDGYEVLEAENGFQALDLLASKPVDVVVTDIMMDGMDGYELMRRIRSDERLFRLPVIAVTECDPKFRKAAIQAGADDFIFRPVMSKLLHRRVDGLLGSGLNVEHYQMAFDNCPIAFVLFQVEDGEVPGYRALYSNQAAKEESLINGTDGTFQTDEYPQQRDLLLATLRSGEKQQKVFYVKEVDRYVDAVSYVDGYGLVAVMVTDITEQIHDHIREKERIHQLELR